MDMREAFDKFTEEYFGKNAPYPSGVWDFWQTACEWQKQKDAEICNNIQHLVERGVECSPNMAKRCEIEILNQWKDNG